MPMLTEEQIKKGFFHDDIAVRSQVLGYFRNMGGPPNLTVMPLVIVAINRFGLENAFEFNHLFTDLPQTAESVAWAAGLLGKRAANPLDDFFSSRDAFADLLRKADPELVRPHAEVILNCDKIDETDKAKVRRRLTYWTWDASRLWETLEQQCRDRAAPDNEIPTEDRTRVSGEFDHQSWDATDDLLQSLARFGESIVPRMTEYLTRDLSQIAFEDEWLLGMELATVRLAGYLRHVPSVPVIMTKLLTDQEELNSDCDFALSKIASVEVAHAIRENYSLELDWGLRLFMAGVLGRIPSEHTVATIMELIRLETDAELVDILLTELFGLFSSEGNDFGIRMIPKHKMGRDATSVLLASCQLTGQTFPEFNQWKEAEKSEKLRRRKERENYEASILQRVRDQQAEAHRDRLAATPIRPGLSVGSPVPSVKRPTPGRNDPCFCGSGKKFKKCCQLKNG